MSNFLNQQTPCEANLKVPFGDTAMLPLYGVPFQSPSQKCGQHFILEMHSDTVTFLHCAWVLKYVWLKIFHPQQVTLLGLLSLSWFLYYISATYMVQYYFYTVQ